MYTILMNEDKSLSQTIVKTLFQGESQVDKLRFLVPRKYGELYLSEFNIILVYIDPMNIIHREKLILTEQLYKEEYLCYILPVDSKLTNLAGKINLRLVCNKSTTEASVAAILKSGETIITIESIKSVDLDTPDYSDDNNPSFDDTNQNIFESHEHINKAQLDTYDKSQAELLAVAKEEVQNIVDAFEMGAEDIDAIFQK